MCFGVLSTAVLFVLLSGGGRADDTQVIRPLPRFTVTDLAPLPGAEGSEGLGLNDSGRVVGDSDDQAVIWVGGRPRALKPLRAGQSSKAKSINTRGQIAGFSGTRAVLWQGDGAPRDLGTLGGSPQSVANALNASGVVVGTSHGHAFRWQAGRMQDLGTLGGMQSYADGLNDAGHIGGAAEGADGHYHAYLWRDGRMQDLGTLGGGYSIGPGIGEDDQVVGVSVTAPPDSVNHAFLWQQGRMQDLGTLAGASSAAAVNRKGWIVGTSDHRAVLWVEGRLVNLNRRIPPGTGWTLEEAAAVNSRGQIAGTGRLKGRRQAFLLTPVTR